MCFYPITLKSGEVVPCGHCEECYNQRRTEWSVRLQLHTLSYDRMPLFVTLTYAPEFLPEEGLKKKDLQNYIKRIRDKYNLYNTDFSFYACGEHGDLLGRPHYHVLLFGMSVYDDIYLRDDELCRSVIESDWKLGECFVCRADWSGIHYVTKYCMKYLDREWNDVGNPPFSLCSKGIGNGFLESDQYIFIKSCVNVEKFRKFLNDVPQLDFTNHHTLYSTSNEILDQLKPFVESTKIVLPSGKSVLLPRYYRKKLYGSYENWKDNPFAYYRMVQKWNRYAKSVINGAKPQDRILVKQQQIAKRMFQKGHLVKPKNNFVVK